MRLPSPTVSLLHTTEEPVNFLVSSGRDSEYDHLRDPLGIPFDVGECQSASP